MRIITVISYLLALFTLSASNSAALAEQVNGKTVEKYKPEYWSNKKHPKEFYDMKEPAVLPGLPGYTGRLKFLHGIMESRPSSAKTYNMSFLAMDNPGQIINWYRKAVILNNGQITDSSLNSIVVRTAQGNRCTISASPLSQTLNGQKYQSKLTILYRESEKNAASNLSGQANK